MRALRASLAIFAVAAMIAAALHASQMAGAPSAGSEKHSESPGAVKAGEWPPAATGDPPVHRPNAYNATMEISNMTFSISEGSVLRHLEKLVSFKTRYTYSRQSLEASEYIYEVLESCGLQVDYDDWLSGTTEHRNVIATMEGENASAPAYYLGTHYDSTSNLPYAEAPGADDDGTGTAAVLAAAEALSHYRFNRSIVFCAFSGEEQGLLGSKAYAKQLYNSNVSVAGAICLDMVGYNPAPGDADLYVRANAASMDLADFTHNISKKYPAMIINGSAKLDPATNSDHAAFWPYGWDAVNFIEERYSSNPNYHKTTDTIGYLNMTYAANSTQLAVACMAELAGLRGFDERGPIFQNPTPPPGGYANETPLVSVCALDPSGIDALSIRLRVNGTLVSHAATPMAGGYNVSYRTAAPFGDGLALSCRIEANDTLGHPSTLWWNSTVDAVAPGAPELSSISLMRVRPSKSGLVMNVGVPDSYDDYHVINPSVMKDGSVFKMWYGAYDGMAYRIAYATSPDGINWTKHGIVLDLGAAGEPDWRHVADCSVVKVGPEYKMWYSGNNGTSYRILYANSTDGVNWTRQGLAIDHGPSGSLDDQQALNPDVIFTGSEYLMLYAGSDGLTYRILAAASADGLVWTRRGTALDAGRLGVDECVSIQGPAIAYDGAGYLCWYMGNDGYRTRIYAARSVDGLNWTKFGLAVDLGTGADYDTAVTAHPCAIVDNGTVRLWYNGLNGYYRILHASMPLDSPGYTEESVVVQWTPAGGEADRCEVFVTSSWAGCLVPPATGWTRATSQAHFIHNPAGAGNATTFYYAVRTVDRVGHASIHWMRAVKVAALASAGWTPLGAIDPGRAGLASAFETLQWSGVMAWNASDAENSWRTNFTVRSWMLNDLSELWPMAGCWVNVPVAMTHVAVGLVGNVTVQLQQGWNLVSMPHVSQVSYAQAISEIGASCTAIEGFDLSATYRMKVLGAGDALSPGYAYWIYMTSAAPWVVNNY